MRPGWVGVCLNAAVIHCCFADAAAGASRPCSLSICLQAWRVLLRAMCAGHDGLRLWHRCLRLWHRRLILQHHILMLQHRRLVLWHRCLMLWHRRLMLWHRCLMLRHSYLMLWCRPRCSVALVSDAVASALLLDADAYAAG